LRSLRSRTLLVVVLITTALVAAVLPLSRVLLERSFGEFERRSAEGALLRLELLLQERSDHLSRSLYDYARWNQTVAFVEGRNPRWVEDNLDSGVLDNYDLDYVILADRTLRPVYAGARAQRVGQAPGPYPARLDATAAEVWLQGPAAQAALRSDVAIARFEQVNGAWYLVARCPIAAPEADPVEPAGLMVWARRFDAQHVADLARLAQVPFNLRAPSAAANATQSTVKLAGERILGVLPLRDAEGEITALAEIVMLQPLIEQRHAAQRVILLVLLGTVVLAVLIGAVLLDVLIVRRIRRLSASVQQLRHPHAEAEASGGPAHPHLQGDEIDALGADFAELTQELDASAQSWKQQAERDYLTGLPNRARLLADLPGFLASGPERGQLMALMLIDIDGFKTVNDLLGYHAGDALLREAALRVTDSIVAPGAAYRLGGDEFAALVPFLHDAEEALQLAQRLSMGLVMTRIVDGRPLPVAASIGVATSTYAEPLSASELLIRADIALYDVKNQARGGIRMFSEQAHAAFRDRIELESALRAALDEQRLDAWLQPVVASQDGSVVGFEALARWHEPGRGWIDPARFIAAAERAQLACRLDLCVIDKALARLTEVRRLLPRARLSVNVSPQTLLDPKFLSEFEALLQRHVMPPKWLAVELTESDLGISDDRIEACLYGLRRIGVPLLIDDFGIGASSLGRLAKLRPAGLKIDGSFVRDLDGDGGRICRVVIELARELGMRTTAEFVETAEQQERLRAMGCDFQQGYRFAPALDGDRLMAWLEERAAVTAAQRTGFLAT